MAEGNGAHGHQGAEVDAPGHEPLRQAFRIQGIEQGTAGHGEWQGAVEVGLGAGGQPVVEGVAQARIQGLVRFVHGGEQVIQ